MSDSSSESSDSDNNSQPIAFKRRQITTHEPKKIKISNTDVVLGMVEQAEKSAAVFDVVVDDTDGLDPAAEHAAWIERETYRLNRDINIQEA